MEGKMIGIIMLGIFIFLLFAFLVLLALAFMRQTGSSWKEIGIIWGITFFVTGWFVLALFLAERGI
jgi:hypothetical protein